jgi:hypothetical protein
VYREYDLKPGATVYERSTPLYTEASNVAIKAKRMLQIFREAQRPQEFNMSFTVQDGALRLQDLMARAETNGFGSAQLYDAYARMCAGTYALGQSFQTSPWTVEPGLVQDLKTSLLNLENLLFL